MLAPHLAKGDILIDAGNANFRDTRRRVAEYERRASISSASASPAARRARATGRRSWPAAARRPGAASRDILTAIAAKFEGEPCAALVGPDGAGHFVKTIHNGIEYADMQMIAEVYGIMRDGLGPGAEADGRGLPALERGAAQILSDRDHRPRCWRRSTSAPASRSSTSSSTRAGQKGTGRWSVMEAQDLGVPATVIEAAVAARALSSQKAARLAAETQFGAAERKLDTAIGRSTALIRALEQALLAGKIAAYAQGFAVMAKASEAWSWNLPLGTIARIWRAGCIIRSVFLDDISKAFAASGTIANLMTVEPFTGMLKATNASLRLIVAQASLKGIAVPALSLGARLFRPDAHRPHDRRPYPGASATSSAPTASSASTSPARKPTGRGQWGDTSKRDATLPHAASAGIEPNTTHHRS